MGTDRHLLTYLLTLTHTHTHRHGRGAWEASCAGCRQGPMSGVLCISLHFKLFFKPVRASGTRCPGPRCCRGTASCGGVLAEHCRLTSCSLPGWFKLLKYWRIGALSCQVRGFPECESKPSLRHVACSSRALAARAGCRVPA